ncbi:MAG: peptide chain release factor N(5)-glutamine methyltransferase [Rhizomicrobium sp.]
MIAADALANAAAKLAANGTESARLDARVLLAHVLEKRPGELLGRFEISATQMAAFHGAISRRLAHEPVAYITGHKEFWSLDFEVGPGVLVPRPETETLIEQVLLEFPDRVSDLKAIDWGTGSGCIALSFLSEFPNAQAFGIERSSDAMAFARRNKARYPFGDRLALGERDWRESPAGPFDIAFCNPPYLALDDLANVTPELRAEPEAALLGGPDGLTAYRVLAPLIAERLTAPTGRAFLEIGAGQSHDIIAILASAGLETMRIAPDLSGTARCIVARPQKTVGISGRSL